MVSPSKSYTFNLNKMTGYQLNSECPLKINTPQTVTTLKTDPYWVLKINCDGQHLKPLKNTNTFIIGNSVDLPKGSKSVGYLFVKERIKGQEFGALGNRITSYVLSEGADYGAVVYNHPLESEGVIVLVLFRTVN